MISIIITTYNEEEIIEKTLKVIKNSIKNTNHEIIVCDGGSSDNTVNIAKNYTRVVVSKKKGKAIQINKAVKKTKGDILFFTHADFHITEKIIKAIEDKIYLKNYDGGGFSNRFSTHNNKIKILGRILNFRIIDNDHKNNLIFFGDNGIFCKTNVFQALGGFKEIPIMEDYDFSKRMRDSFNIVRIKEPYLLISSRRHIKDGFIKTRLKWIIIKKLYLLGISPNILNRIYKDIR